MSRIKLYYDFRSPFAYFASQRLSLLRDEGAEISWHPVSVSMLLNMQVDKEPWAQVEDPMCKAKRNHFMADIFRLIEHWKIPFAPPVPMPPECTTAMAIAALLDKEQQEHTEFRDAMFAAVWQEQKDANDIDVLESALKSANHDPELIQIAATEGKALLTELSCKAFEQGVFGVPSFIVDDALYFGADRMDLIAAHLRALR